MSLVSNIKEAIAGTPGVFGVYARNLITGETIDINADRIFPAESAAKSFILVYYSQLVASRGRSDHAGPARRRAPVHRYGSFAIPGVGTRADSR